MGKVTISNAVDTGRKTKNGNPIINVTLLDGRRGGCFDGSILSFIQKEIDLEIKENGEYNGVKQYIFNIPKFKNEKIEAKNSGQNVNNNQCTDNSNFEKRKIALQCAVNSLSGGLPNKDGVIDLANEYLKFLSQ